MGAEDLDRIAVALDKMVALYERSLTLSEAILEAQRTNAALHGRVLTLQEKIYEGNIDNHRERIEGLERAYKALDLVALEKSMVTTFTLALSGITGGTSLLDFVERVVRRMMADAGIGTAR